MNSRGHQSLRQEHAHIRSMYVFCQRKCACTGDEKSKKRTQNRKVGFHTRGENDVILLLLREVALVIEVESLTAHLAELSCKARHTIISVIMNLRSVYLKSKEPKFNRVRRLVRSSANIFDKDILHMLGRTGLTSMCSRLVSKNM